MTNDHEIKSMADAAMYLALRHEAQADDRTMGGLLRHIVALYLHRRATLEAEASERPEPGQD